MSTPTTPIMTAETETIPGTGELVQRVRALSDVDRSLDAEIDVALFGGETQWKQANYTMEMYPVTKRPSKMHVGGFAYEAVPFYTASIDAAAGAVMQKLPVNSLRITMDPSGCGAKITWWPEGLSGGQELEAAEASVSPALAVVAALLAVLAAKDATP